MKRTITIAILAAAIFSIANVGEGARHPRRVRTTRVRVTVRPGFPIRRTLPNVVVRPAPLVRVAPRVYLSPVVFGAVVIASLPAANLRVWSADEDLDREDGWTDFTMNIDKRGNRLLLQIEKGAAQISFAEVVFESGETQVVDFNDKIHRRGIYSLLDFQNGRKVDHVRVVAKAAGDSARITLHLVS